MQVAVIPAKAGIHSANLRESAVQGLDSRPSASSGQAFRGNDWCLEAGPGPNDTITRGNSALHQPPFSFGPAAFPDERHKLAGVEHARLDLASLFEVELEILVPEVSHRNHQPASFCQLVEQGGGTSGAAAVTRMIA